MADKKISQLTALAAANLAPSTDVLAIVDTSATETKKIVAQDLINGVLNVASAVGIGTASPAVKLHVQGSAGQIMRVTDGTTGASIYSGGGLFGFNNQTGEDGMFGSTASHFLYFATNGTEKLRLDSSGNLGLGVTPNVWLSSFRAIQLGQGSSLWGAATGNNAGFDSNVYVNTSGGSIYVGSTFATRYQQSDGTHKWYISTDPTPTAGNPISFTQAMTLDASSNLSVATTSTYSAYAKLHVLNGLVTATNATDGGVYIGATTGGTELAYLSMGRSYNLASTGEIALATTGAKAILFGTNNTERGRFTSGGELLVGNGGSANPQSAKFYVVGSGYNATAIRVASNGNVATSYLNESGTEVGYVQVNASSTTYSTSSDRRRKTNIVPADDAGSLIDAIQIVKHEWKAGGDVRYAVIAQDLYQVAPEAVSVGDDGEEVERSWGVDYSKLVPMLVKEIQSLRSRVAALEAK